MAKKQKAALSLIVNEDYVEKPKKKFSTHDLIPVSAKTDPQHEFFVSYYKKQTPIIVQVGSAGTGKTYIALYAALSDVLESDNEFDKVVIIRSAVQSRDIGFLKGSEEEKNAAYESPYIALCDDLLKFKINNYVHLKQAGFLGFENSSFLRGTTYHNTIVIADEIQNMTYRELKTIVTRLGDDSRMILCGDFKQTDLVKKGDESGLQQLLSVMKRMSNDSVSVINYTPKDVVRSGIVREFLLAEEDS